MDPPIGKSSHAKFLSSENFHVYSTKGTGRPMLNCVTVALEKTVGRGSTAGKVCMIMIQSNKECKPSPSPASP